MKKTTTIFMALVFAGTLVSAQTTTTTQTTKTTTTTTTAAASADDPIIVAAGDVTIRRSEFENAVKTLPPEYQQFATGPGKKQFAEDYLRMKILAAQGMKEGLQNSPEVVQQLSLMRENLVANAELQKIEKGITVSDADLQKIYDQNKKDYEQVKARHILIAYKGSPAAQPGKTELTEEQAKAKAEQIKKDIESGKTSFEDAAKKESDDKGSGARGGDLGAFGRGQMVEEFEKAAFDAKPGTIVGPVRTQYGYHLIEVQSHETTSFDKVKAQLESKERQRKTQEALDNLKKGANPTFNEAYFAPPAPKMEAGPEPAKPAADTKKPATKKP